MKSETNMFLVLSYHVYSKQPIFGLTQEWFRELSFFRLECGVLYVTIVDIHQYIYTIIAICDPNKRV